MKSIRFIKSKKPSVLKSIMSDDALQTAVTGAGVGASVGGVVGIGAQIYSGVKNRPYNNYIQKLQKDSRLNVSDLIKLTKKGKEKGLKGKDLDRFIELGGKFKKQMAINNAGPAPKLYSSRGKGSLMAKGAVGGGLIGLGRGARQNYKSQVSQVKNIENMNKMLTQGLVGGTALAATGMGAVSMRKNASALRSRAIESLIGATGGGAGGAYVEKRTRRPDEFGTPQTNKERKMKYIAGGALAGALGTSGGSKLKRILKKREAKKELSLSIREMSGALDEARADLRGGGLSALNGKKRRKVKKAEELLRYMQDGKAAELAKDRNRIDSSVFGGRKKYQKGDRNYYRNLIQSASRMKDSL